MNLPDLSIIRPTNLRAVVLSLAVFLAACGSDDDSEPGAPPPDPVAGGEVINGVSVPQQPSDTDDAVLLGADHNGNGVRDKVERALAAEYGAQNHSQLMAVAATLQTFLSTPASDTAAVQTQLDRISRQSYCYIEKTPNDGAAHINTVSLMSFDSKERMLAFRERQAAAGTRIRKLDTSPCEGQ